MSPTPQPVRPTQPAPSAAPRSRNKALRKLGRVVSQNFFRGLIAILPIGATIFVLVWLAGFFESTLRLALEPIVGSERYYPGMGVAAGVVLIFLIGVLLNAWIIQQFFMAAESLLHRVPLAKTVMGAVQDLMGFFAKKDKDARDQVVMLHLAPWDMKVIGFVTRSDLGDLPPGMNDATRVAVYIPLSYQIGGFTVLIERSALQPVDMSMEDAMRFALTAGVKRS